MSTAYLAHTPYHVFLASAMAESAETHTELILVQDSDSDLLGEVLLDAGVFDDMMRLPGLYGQNSFFLRRITLISNIARLQFHLRRTSPDTLVVFNDQRQETQAALYACRSNTCIYAEDGTGAYSSITHPDYSGISLAVRKLSYGYWYDPPAVMGTSKWIDKVRATNPSTVRGELKEYPVDKIPSSELRCIGEQSWVQEYLIRLGVSPATLAKSDLVLTPTHSSLANRIDGYAETYRLILEAAVESGLSVLINYHPRDTNQAFSASNCENVSVLPDGLSFEFIAASVPNATVVGDVSTVLFTTAVLSQSDVVSIGPALEFENEELYQTFKNVGVEVVNDVNSLYDWFPRQNKKSI